MRACFLVVMGVAGSGKSAVGQALAARLGWEFYDADAYHPPANIAKMASGVPLDDDDRAPWLAALHELIDASLAQGRSGIMACSALKESYRQILRSGHPEVQFVHLEGSYDLIAQRLAARPGHYMKPAMLRSQFETLETPSDAWVVNISPPVAAIVETILAHLRDRRLAAIDAGSISSLL